ncbi:hypothetical protein B484DRAFT_400236 [Ochromonadaceae sp. CCMP2298]|nr:hypothetical protein B484DRAFT_400236 [Ochromonadaceae sp. CCMP2298]
MLILLCLCALSAGAFRFTARSASTTSISTSTSAPHIHHTHRHHTHHHRHALLMATETAYLSVTEVADRYKLITYGQRPKQTYGLESLDRTCYVAAKEAEVSRVGGIGLELEEIYNYGDGSGIVLVAGMVPGSNADGGQFLAGDALTSVTAVDSKGAELTPPTALTGLNYDRTLSALSRFGDFDLLRFTVQRLRKRGEIVVKVVGPQNEVLKPPSLLKMSI